MPTKRRMRNRQFPVMLAALATLLLAACSAPQIDPNAPGRPFGLTVSAGPVYAAVGWVYTWPVTPDSFVIERQERAGGAWSAWHEVVTLANDREGYVDEDILPDIEYRYRVGAVLGDQTAYDNASDDTRQSVRVDSGLHLLAGTMNRGFGSVNGTVLAAFLVFADDEALPDTLTFQGPPGWNGGAAETVTLNADHISRGAVVLTRINIDAVDGEYSVSGGGHEASYLLADASWRLDPPANLNLVADLAAEALTASWQQPVAAATASANLQYRVDSGSAYADLTGYPSTDLGAIDFTVPGAQPGQYRLEVNAANMPLRGSPFLLPRGPFGMAYAVAEFDVP